MRKIPVKELKKMFPDDILKQAFYADEDNQKMYKGRMEEAWIEQKKGIGDFMEMLSTIPAIVI